MTTRSKFSYITPEEYLAQEEHSQTRHEYVGGLTFVMTGVTYRHNIIAGNIFSILHSRLRGSQCRATMSDMKACVESMNSYYYPDVMVSCGQYLDDAVIASNPVLIVEVLSRSTATIDKREKVIAYRQIESLLEYMIVHQRKRRVELHRRIENGTWEVLEFDADDAELVLESIPTGPLKLTFDAIYEDVNWGRSGGFQIREEADAGSWGQATEDGGEKEEGALDW
jgi:Uma2 family endonuclease